MAKRKREGEKAVTAKLAEEDVYSKISRTNGHIDVKTVGPVIQIVTGSYERVLHGITASLSDLATSNPSTQFADSFLFNAHASAIRCLAISPLPQASPTESSGVFLATGGSDERINVYSLSASSISENDRLPSIPSISNNKISEDPRNRELGAIMQHSSNVTALHFPTRSKLISASEDNTIAVSRTRDLTVVSTIKAPRPKALGQPSGDTAPVGVTPAGVNDFAVHPSMKLMISVGRGEKCMRLWNLVTGKKASVLNFDRETLQAIKESKHSSGEGRKIRWNADGTEFAVSFERGVAIYGEDAKPKCIVLPQPLTKVHQIAYHAIADTCVLAVSTEDGRIVFYNTASLQTTNPDISTPSAKALGQLGGKAAELRTRIKDFKLLTIKQSEGNNLDKIVVAGSSDGTIRIWSFSETDLKANSEQDKAIQIGKLLGKYETGGRITCLDAFVMQAPVEEETGLSEFEGLTEAEEGAEESSSDSDDN